tara:strand:+ start:272 stop:535 length:264 start_codon:yes stop_codon:yes gene_type:complete
LTDLKKKILWQCRRGLWELDAILIPFVEENFDDLDSKNKKLFTELLSYEDVELLDLLVNQKKPEDSSIQQLIDIIIASHVKTIEIDR